VQRLAPRERAAVVLKDVFDMSLEETAEVLETTVGAIKAALHRGRERLRASDEEAVQSRPAPSRAFVDRFVELFNQGDKAALVALMIDNGSTENVGAALHYGAEAHRGPRGWFEGALGGHPEWPEWWRYESQRAERATYRGEPLVLLFQTRRAREAVVAIVRLEEDDGRLARLRSYGFCPETMRTVCEELGVPVLTGLYRHPTPEPGGYYRLELPAGQGNASKG
jgi:RNA polymerase sigma-70 factor (ECF subfamily)